MKPSPVNAPPLFARLLARLPLPLLHLIGAVIGIAGLLRGRHRRIVIDNLRQAGLYRPWRLPGIAAGLGQSVLEVLPVWQRPLPEVLGWVREVRGWHHVEAARSRGVVFIAPHLGCWELAFVTLATRMPIAALYTPPRENWMHALMKTGRERGQGRTVPPTLAGVRTLLTTLKRRESVFILPDQSASQGEGVWTDFFGRPAYLPTLPYRLIGATEATPLLVYCERMSWGRGFRLHIEPLPALPPLPAGRAPSMQQVLGRIEAWIGTHPDQYLWSYRIYRSQGDGPPGSTQEAA